MEINVRDLFNKVKSTAQQVGTKATKMGKEIMSNTKLNIRVMDLNSQIDAEYKAAGKLLYAVHCGEEIDPEAIDEILAGIDGKKAELEELKDALAKAKAAYTCPNCGKTVGKAAAFCSACGTKIERPEPEIEVEIVTVDEAECAEVCEEAAGETCCCEEAAEGTCCCEETAEDGCCEEKAE